MDLSHWIDRHARFTPLAVAIRFEGRDITYSELAARIQIAAAALATRGVRKGDAVAYLGLNHPAVLITLFACARLGAMFAPLNWRLAPPELARVLADCPPRLLLAEPAYASIAQSINGASAVVGIEVLEESASAIPPVTGGEETPLLLCYTSGSTGAPKGVVLPQRALFWNAVNSTHMHDLTSADRILTTLPLFHVGGLNILTTPALHAGASVTLHARFDPQAALDTIERERITLTVLVPAQLTAMMELPRWQSADLSSLRMITTGSTIVPEAFVRKVSSRGVPVVQVYGATETCPIAAYVRAPDALRKAGSAGSAALHCELKIDAPAGGDGEILVRGPNVASTSDDGWYHSGDVGHLDEEGHLYVVARMKDLIISGGENIYPEEVEGALARCPGVASAAVVGMPDERLGSRVVAFVEPASAEVSVEAIDAACLLTGLARFKRPREYVFVKQIPRSASGKLLRRKLRIGEYEKW